MQILCRRNDEIKMMDVKIMIWVCFAKSQLEMWGWRRWMLTVKWCNISGGGGGNGSSWLIVVVSISWLGNGGKSGLGIRNIGFFGGRSGIHSSTEMIEPIITGPSRSFEMRCFSWCRYAAYSAADDVLYESIKIQTNKQMFNVIKYFKKKKFFACVSQIITFWLQA